MDSEDKRKVIIASGIAIKTTVLTVVAVKAGALIVGSLIAGAGTAALITYVVNESDKASKKKKMHLRPVKI